MNKYLIPLGLLLNSLLIATSALAADVVGSVASGEKKVAMCIGCHGISGYQATFPEVHRVPMISGQNAGYIAAALKAYREGERKHPTMRAIAASLTDQDIADVAAYYEQHGKTKGQAESGAPAKPSQQPSAKVAELLNKNACAACHGANFSKPMDASQPKIAGQYKDYLYVALKAYKTEGNHLVGRNNAVMGGVVKNLSLSDLKELSNYIGGLEGELKVVPQPKHHHPLKK